MTWMSASGRSVSQIAGDDVDGSLHLGVGRALVAEGDLVDRRALQRRAVELGAGGVGVAQLLGEVALGEGVPVQLDLGVGRPPQEVARELGEVGHAEGRVDPALHAEPRSFRLYSSSAVPSVTPDEGVSGVKFSADLSEATPMALGDLPECPMFDALRTLKRHTDA